MILHLPTENSRWSDHIGEIIIKKVDNYYTTYNHGYSFPNKSFFSWVVNDGLKPLLKVKK